MADEQQGFRSGRSYTDVIFVLRQLTKKSIEFNRLAFTCFIELQKAFDRIQLKDIIHLLRDRQIPHNIIMTIEKNVQKIRFKQK